MASAEATLIRQSEVSVLPSEPVIIIGGADVITDYNRRLDKAIKVYNRRLELLSSPYFVRIYHSVNEYEYPGRYVYRKIWDEEAEKMREEYVGYVIPEEDVPAGGIPRAPVNVLEGFVYRGFYHDIICSKEMFNRFFRFFEGKEVITLRIQT